MADEQAQDQNSTEQAGQENSQAEVFEIDGQEMTAKQLHESYQNLKAFSTKTAQELADIKKQGESQEADQPSELDQLVEALAPALEKRGFAKQGDLRAYSESAKLEKLVSENPNLAKNKKILDGLMKAYPDRPVEEIVHEYGLNGTDSLSKGGQDVMGESSRTQKQEVDVENMNDKQLAEWEAKQGIGKKGFQKKPDMGN